MCRPRHYYFPFEKKKKLSEKKEKKRKKNLNKSVAGIDGQQMGERALSCVQVNSML